MVSVTLTALLEALRIDTRPACFETLYPAAALEYAAQGCIYVQERFLQALDREFDLFPRRREAVYRAAAAIRENELLARYTVLLAQLTHAPRQFYAEREAVRLPEAPQGEDPLPYEMTGFFALIATVPDEARALRARRVPEDVIRSTVQGHDLSVMIFERSHGRPGFDTGRIGWCLNFAPPSNTLTIGRFNFAPSRFDYPAVVLRSRTGAYRILMANARFHRSGLVLGSPAAEDEDGAFDADFVETDTYYEGYPPAPTIPGKPARVQKTRVRLPKSGWEVVLRPGDPYLVTHIPPVQAFGHDIQRASYRRAREIYANCYPDLGIRAIHCRSWLIAPQMQAFLKPDSNIVAFQRDHLLYPAPCNGQAVFSHLFLQPVERMEDLPERTAMERGVKAVYVGGGVIYECAGFNITREANDPPVLWTKPDENR